jgi:hypothetical protein
MADGYGTPIRLHFDDPTAMAAAGYSNGMELSALSIALSVERKVGGMPAPFTGGRRYGIDLNRVNSTIIIEGIFVDDDLSRATKAATAAQAEIDFAFESKYALINEALAAVNPAFYQNLATGLGTLQFYLKLPSGATSAAIIQFESSSGAVGHVSGVNIRVYDTSTGTSITGAQLATAVETAINTATALSNYLTVTVVASKKVPSAGNTRLIITQKNAGPMNRSTSLLFNNSAEFSPYHTQFTGGSDASNALKSAGDKVQDLYGILHNTQRNGSSVVAGGLIAAGAILATGGLAAPIAGVALGIGAGATTLATDGDYPIGLQIPYNSMITAPDGQKYAARNFLVPTGLGLDVNDKMSQNNNKAAGGEFLKDDKFTGIKGAIQKFDVGYSAGEQVYTYQMVFAPIDVLA